MTSKTTEKLCYLEIELLNIRKDFKDHPASKSRFGSLVITKLEEAMHWLNDLIDGQRMNDLIDESVREEEKEK
jgi:hypothetical protein